MPEYGFLSKLSVVLHDKGNQLHEGRYGEWLALHQVLAGNCRLCYNYLFIHAWNHYYTINAVSSSGVVVTCTLERILFLDFKLGLYSCN